MSDQSSSEKTEHPTEKRLRDARQRGQVARSSDLVTGLATVAVVGAVMICWPQTVTQLRELILFSFTLFEGQPSDYKAITEAALKTTLAGVLPILLAVIVGVTLGNVLQIGFFLAFESLKPDLAKLNPVSAFQKMFSPKSLLEVGKSIIKISVIASVLWMSISSDLGLLLQIPLDGHLYQAAAVVGPLLLKLFGAAILIYLALAAGDYFVQRYFWLKELKMTKDEVKREYKETEGDPRVKGARRQFARQLIFEDPVSNVKNSTVLVTNPTHYAAGIFYERGKMQLPVLRTKGSGFTALRMIEAARDANIPIIQNVPLAHALCENLKVNDAIPSDLAAPVAEVLRWAFSIRERNSSS